MIKVVKVRNRNIMEISETKKNILLNSPLEIFEQFGLYLSIFDLANLELVSKDVRDRVLQTKLWKKNAFRISRKFNFI